MKKSRDQIKIDKIKNDICNFNLLAPGRLRTTYMKCGNPTCACHKDKKARHGPYHLWDRKVGTKITSKMVSTDARKKIENWIKERKKNEILVAEVIKISQKIIAEDIDKKREKK
jgi:hypothetical protein